MVFRDHDTQVQVNRVTEITSSSTSTVSIKDNERRPVLEVNPVSIVSTYRPVLQEIPEPTIELCKRTDEYHPGSPMSLDKSIASMMSIESAKKELRSNKRDGVKTLKNNFYDVDEYRADIYNYLRIAEVI